MNKLKIPILLVLMASLVGLPACESDSAGEDDVMMEDVLTEVPEARHNPIAFHEQQLAKGEVQFAQLHDHVIMRLEKDEPHEFDTGANGDDMVPVLYEKDIEHTICFDDDSGFNHLARLRTHTGETLAEVSPGGCVTITAPAGLHHLELHSGDGAVGDTTLFIRPGKEEDNVDDYGTESVSGALDTDAPAPCGVCDSTGLSAVSSLESGHVAVGTTCPDSGGTSFQKVVSCDDTQARGWTGGSDALVLAPLTQAILFTSKEFSGSVELVRNDNPNQPMCLGPGSHSWASFLAGPTTGTGTNMCVPARAFQYCHGEPGCESSTADKALSTLGDDEVAILGAVDTTKASDTNTTTCCVHGWVFNHDSGPCEDLSMLGFDNATYNVLIGDNAVIHLYRDANLTGASVTMMKALTFNTTLHPGSIYALHSLPPNSGITPGPGTVSSLRVETTETENALTVISSKECEECDMRGVDLSNQSLSGARLSGANLVKANLSYAQLDGADLSHATLSGADCTYTNFAEANLDSSTLAGNGHDVAAANFQHAVLADASLKGVQADGVHFQYTHFIDTGEGTASLSGAQLVGAKFDNAVLKGVSFDKADVTGASFSGAILLNAALTSLSVDTSSSCDNTTSFSGAILYGADFRQSSFGCVDLSNAMLSFQPGTYALNHYLSWDKSLASYNFKTTSYGYEATVPNMLPLLTDNSTTCPDGAHGPCTGMGGESCKSCPADCNPSGGSCSAKICTVSWQCVALPWSLTSHGRFCCKDGACTEQADTTFCGDDTCDFLGGETDLTCPTDCHCGDGTCDSAKGETGLTCPVDCTVAGGSTGVSLECLDGSQCVGLEWTLDGLGHWECPDGECTAVLDESSNGPHCGDGVCSRDGRWMALKPPISYVTNGPWSLVGPCGSLW